jgi:hypothetical protein
MIRASDRGCTEFDGVSRTDTVDRGTEHRRCG